MIHLHFCHLYLTSANTDQVDKAKEMIKKLQFSYKPEAFENPSLQKHYVNLEAMALDRDAPEDITDYTRKYIYMYYGLLYISQFNALF